MNYKPRKATFTVTGKGDKRIFTPVNHRAKIVAKKLGRRTRITAQELRATKNVGTYQFFAYNKGDNSLRAIRV